MTFNGIEEAWKERNRILDICVEHGMYRGDAEQELNALIGRNLSSYTLRIRRILQSEGLWDE